MQYNPIEIANNLRQSNGGIPGIRPGKRLRTISSVFSPRSLCGCVLPGHHCDLPDRSELDGPEPQFSGNGGTTILIVVSVALETVRTLESEMMMRHHKGFLE